MQRFINNYITNEGKLYRKGEDKELGWLCNGRYLMFDHSGKKYLVHRAIFLLSYGYLPKMVDHKDRNKLNNKPSNLREIDKRGNSLNSKIRSDNTSGVKGVSFSKSNSKWFSYHWVKGKRVNLGYYKTIGEAKNVRDNYLIIKNIKI